VSGKRLRFSPAFRWIVARDWIVGELGTPPAPNLAVEIGVERAVVLLDSVTGNRIRSGT